MSLDTVGTTVGGIGDLCLGFGAPSILVPAKTLDGAGEATFRRVVLLLLLVSGLVLVGQMVLAD